MYFASSLGFLGNPIDGLSNSRANPYKPPSARVDDATVEDISRPPARRPLFVWIITACYGFGLILNLLVMVLSVRGFGKSAPGIMHSSTDTPASVFIDAWAVGAVQVADVVLLFRLRAAAPYFLVASFLVGMIPRFAIADIARFDTSIKSHAER